jgi:hypothetical protein
MWAAAAAMGVLAAAAAGCSKHQDNTASAPGSSAAPAAEVQPTLTPGKVTSVTGSELVIASSDTPATFALGPQTVIMVAHKGSLADIKPGSFLGTTNVPSADGTGQSTEVHIFPPGVKMGEGDRPMGPANAAAASSRMTNGTVSAAAPETGASSSRMTNGAAGQVSASGQGVEMDVDYAGGKRHISVPANTPVMVMTSGTTELLKPGTNVLVGSVPGPNGAKTATFVNVQ